ncbi:MAG TPA: glycosyltransferase [Ardenticatenaceae bacterium]|nr:glycosyltransferase [Ardenticatenaceae bacterium]
MKVGLVVPGFSAGEQDWCIPALLDYVRVLARRVELHVFALRYPYRRDGYRVYEARVQPFGAAQGRGARSARLWAGVLAALRAEHRRSRFDLLHAFWADEPGMLVALASRLLGVPAVVSLAGGELARLPEIGYGGQLRAVERAKTRLALRFAERVTAGSHSLLGLARPHVGAGRAEKLRYTPLGVDLDLFSPPTARVEPRPAPFRLLNVASLVPVKDHALLFHALRHARDAGLEATLTLVGTGPLEADLRHLATELGITRSVTFSGSVRREHLPRYYHDAGLFVLSSRHEAQCLAVLEAAACGKPVIGTAVGVVPELAPDVARVVPVGDPRALGEAIVQAARGEKQTCMSQVARDRVQRGYGLEDCVGRFYSLYHELLG